MTITYEIDEQGSKSKVRLSLDKRHLGTVWGTVEYAKDDFERENDIIHINRGDTRIMTLWNVQPK